MQGYNVIIMNDTKIYTFMVELKNANLILAQAPKGFVMCGYLDISVAQNLNDAACVVSGVASVNDLLNKPVVKLTTEAENLGITLGISGREALLKMI